ncbi:P1 family peptidase [Gluconacetobacter entanii]|uniref:P1 family peptidase n=1 Tax=Gluconacetobacter entanii TaxID=108528 RepID=A0ABT3K4B6_9PROT|nr:P1 family peptidase [Gluconacetobacter entanii]MBY4639320.1 P1 family peptidase [Gluconacetobacter entanii]MCW4580432.1 P1 family peptidase [Gluconacetobacter entanii]MCW4583721.1 P1 family peptidase [Gluconacetobacter entanii]MCW4587068.1 P1 family peptidase [Gluconacetobacter entanii]MCW4590216.1 P1 family peptidase [Gluconacetobacter entanii]
MTLDSPARRYRLGCGILPPGPYNAITDVPGVRVGHRTLRNGPVQTGVTCVLPHDGDLFRDRPLGAVHVFNGFGKSVGLMQVEELGQIETPILLTNTLSVSAGAEALIRDAIGRNPEIGRSLSTVNPLVFECNDGRINDIQALAVTPDDAMQAIRDAQGGTVAQGGVGAGTGMTAFGFKGGIGTSSRHVAAGMHQGMLGVLVLANFGLPGDLTLPDGRRIAPPAAPTPHDERERGSVIMVVATDLPLDYRQLRRVIRRAGVGIGRLGSFWGNGSGDVAVGFCPSVRFHLHEPEGVINRPMLNEAHIDTLFRAAAEATQEAVLNALCAATPVTGRNGVVFPALSDVLAAHPHP